MTVRHLGTRDLEGVLALVRDEWGRSGAADAPAFATLEDTSLRAALRARRRHVWVSERNGALGGHLYGAVLGRGSERAAHTGLDGHSGGLRELDSLIDRARRQWRGRGARAHHVWVANQLTALKPWRDLGYEILELRGVMSLEHLRGEEHVAPGLALDIGDLTDAIVFDELIDRAHSRRGLDRSTTRRRHRELARLLGEPDVRHLVVRHGDDAMAQCLSFPGARTRGLPDARVHLSSVAVRESVRRQGLGRLVVHRSLVDARQNGHEFADVTWRAENAAADGFWRAVGFYPAHARLTRSL